MPTTNQLVRNGRKRKKNKSLSPALQGCPQKRGTVLRTYTIDPKKPNSADRKVCRVRLSNGIEVIAYIPGEGHTINEHMAVLIRGGRVKDCPGVKYKVVRGALDDQGERRPHRTRRSKYGVKKKNIEKQK